MAIARRQATCVAYNQRMIRGVIPPLPTPFVDDELDEGWLRDTVARLMETRLAGLLVLGTNGEAPLVEPHEADRIVHIARETMPRDRLLLAGTGRDSTRATIDACLRAAHEGASHALVRPPTSYTALMTPDTLHAHYERVADASPIPVLLYNQPAVFGPDLTPPLVARLAIHQNIAGIKDSSGNIAQISDVVGRVPANFSVLTGAAPLMYASILVGAHGCIVAAANVLPALCVRLFELTAGGHLDRALVLQRALTPLARAVTVQHGVPGLKAAMTLAGFLPSSPRRPLQAAGASVIDELRRMIGQLEETARSSEASEAVQ